LWWTGAGPEVVVFNLAAQLLDACLALVRQTRGLLSGPGRTRHLWRILPGDLLGRLVMFGCGIPAPTRFHDDGDVQALLVEDPRVRLWFRVHAIPVHAQTLGHYVFSGGTVPRHTLAHECEHIRQWERFGPLFLPLYFGSSAAALFRGRRPYWDNAFEVAARTRADLDTAAAAEDETRPKT
jgi:hypothetical protein